jgi:hypothetical protein
MFKKKPQKNFQKKSLEIYICKITKFVKDAKKILQKAKEKFAEDIKNNPYLEYKHPLFYTKITLNQSMQKELALKTNIISGKNFQIIIKNYEKILKILQRMDNNDIISKKNHDFLLQIKAFKQDDFVKNYQNVKQEQPLQKLIEDIEEWIKESDSDLLNYNFRKMIKTLKSMQKNEFINREDYNLLFDIDGLEENYNDYNIIKNYDKFVTIHQIFV